MATTSHIALPPGPLFLSEMMVGVVRNCGFQEPHCDQDTCYVFTWGLVQVTYAIMKRITALKSKRRGRERYMDDDDDDVFHSIAYGKGI